MIERNERKMLRGQLDNAFQESYAVKDLPGRENKEAATKAENRIHHL
jgi:hypothetical protein